MPRVGLKPMVLASKRAKTVHVLDHLGTMTGGQTLGLLITCMFIEHIQLLLKCWANSIQSDAIFIFYNLYGDAGVSLHTLRNLEFFSVMYRISFYYMPYFTEWSLDIGISREGYTNMYPEVFLKVILISASMATP
jgi:hypothetical protein